MNKSATRLNLQLNQDADDALRAIAKQTKLKLTDIVENGIMSELKRLKEKGDVV